MTTGPEVFTCAGLDVPMLMRYGAVGIRMLLDLVQMKRDGRQVSRSDRYLAEVVDSVIENPDLIPLTPGQGIAASETCCAKRSCL